MLFWQKCSKEAYDAFWGPISDLRHSWKEWKERFISIPRQNDLKVSLPPLVQKKGSEHFMGW